MGVEQKLGNMGVVTPRWNRQSPVAYECHVAAAVWTGLLRIEMMSARHLITTCPLWDGLMRPSPRQSDLMIVPACFPQDGPVLRRLYDQMPNQVVISMATVPRAAAFQ